MGYADGLLGGATYSTADTVRPALQLVKTKKGAHLVSSSFILFRKDKDGIEKDKKKVFELFPRLFERKNQLSGTLSGGEQQMLAMGRALMERPRVLLLDEPSMGLAPLLVKEIFSIIKTINEEGTTVLLVEQNANMALSIADYAYVLETGRITLSGPAADLSASEAVRKAYLGG
mgnify:CR=1 FL=1